MNLPPDALKRLAVERTKAVYRLRRADLEREIRELDRQRVVLALGALADVGGDE